MSFASLTGNINHNAPLLDSEDFSFDESKWRARGVREAGCWNVNGIALVVERAPIWFDLLIRHFGIIAHAATGA
jgi:hypothetical protein